MEEYKIDLESAADLDETTIVVSNQHIIDALPEHAIYTNLDGEDEIVGTVERIAEWNGFKVGEEVSLGYSTYKTQVIEYFFRHHKRDEGELLVRWKEPKNAWSFDTLSAIRPLGKGHGINHPLNGKIWDWNEHG